MHSEVDDFYRCYLMVIYKKRNAFRCLIASPISVADIRQQPLHLLNFIQYKL